MDVIRFMLLGLGVGGAYAIEALGVVVIYRASRVVNFAQTGVVAVGAYTFYGLCGIGVNHAASAIAGIVAAAFTGAVIYAAVLRPLRGATDLVRLVGILGAFLVIENAILMAAGDSAKTAPAVLPESLWHITRDLTVQSDRIYLVLISAALTAALMAVSKWTSLGLYTRAVAENETTVRGLGRSADTISLINWMIGGALGGLAGILLASTIGLSPTQLGTLLLPALAAALVGKFYSFPITWLTALGIGVANAEVTRYWPTSGLEESAALAVIVIALLARGRTLPSRDEVMARLPAVGSGRIRPLVVVPLAIAGIVVIANLPVAWAASSAATAATTLVFLSVVVVTGYAGQLSLAQFAIAGSAALLAGKFSGEAGLPFLAVLPLAVLTVVPVGLLIGIPAFRSRGMNLAIATLGLGFVIDQSVLSNPSVTGGAVGTSTRTPELFGFSVDPIAHPNRFGVLAFVVMVVAAAVIAFVRRSFLGRRWLAVRANERAAAAAGVNVMLSKASALSVSAALAGAGGVLYAFSGPTVVFTGYSTDASINAVVLTVIGGIGYFAGAFNGALIASGGLITFAVAQYTGLSYDVIGLIAGLVVIFNVIVAPSGIADNTLKAFRRKPATPGARADMPLAAWDRSETSPAEGVARECLSVRDVSVRFGGVQALKEVSLEIREGEVVGLIGPNGAGKTTLIDIISGFTRSNEGEVLLGGRALLHSSASARARAGMARAFQGIELFEDLTLLDNLRVASEVRSTRSGWRPGKGSGSTLVSPECLDAVERLGLEGDLARRPTELSYGKRRLASVCRALAGGPSFLLLDEPAAGLSQAERIALESLISHLASGYGTGVLLVEHDVPLVLSVCHRVVALDFGHVIATGPPEEVRRSPAVVESYLGVTAEAEVAVAAAEGGDSR